MDFIKKTICIEGARTRTQGLMPYYAFGEKYSQHKPFDEDGNPICYSFGELELEMADGDNGNWGQFVANPCFLAEKGKTYEAMLRKYYDLLNMVRDGVKLRKVETKENEIIFTEDVGGFTWGTCESGGKGFVGGEEPENLYDYAAYDAEDFISTQIDSLRDETRNIYRTDTDVNHDFVVLIKDFAKFQDLTKYLDGTDYNVITSQSIGSNIHTKWADYCKVVDDAIGIINIPASIYNEHIKVPKRMPCADVEPYIEWLENYQELSADCCNARLYEDMGGDDMLIELRKHRGECQDKLDALNDLQYAVPYIEMPLLLVQNYTDVGVLTNIDGVEYEGEKTVEERPHGVGSPTGLTIDEIVMESSSKNHPTTQRYEAIMSAVTAGLINEEEIPEDCKTVPIEVESLLQTLRNKKKFTDDHDNVLPGDFQNFDNPAGEMFACVKRADERFYILDTESYDITQGGETITYWRVVFREDSTITRDDIYGLNNLNYTSIPGGLPSRVTQAEAEGYVEEQREHYQDVEKSAETNPYFYKICVSLAEWTMYDIGGEPQNSINGDGLGSMDVSEGGTRYPATGEEWRSADGRVYRTITTPAAGIRIAQTEEEETRNPVPKDFHYFFYVKYNNSGETPMTIPYKVGNTANVYLVDSASSLYRGDFIIGLTADSGTFQVKYVIGGYFTGDENGNYISWTRQELGDIYYEEYDLDRQHIDYVALDGVDRVPVYSEYIDFAGASKEFYSPIYDLYRTGNTANIIRLTSGDIWSEEFNKTLAWQTYDAYLAKEEYLTNFSLPPKVDVNVTVDRGGVSAFEKHYKLSECNTMQDLVNYGNNFFNI